MQFPQITQMIEDLKSAFVNLNKQLGENLLIGNHLKNLGNHLKNLHGSVQSWD